MADTPSDLARRLFETLVREHHKRILAFAASLCRDPNQAEDLAQEAFLTAFRKLDEFDPERDFGNWVRGIVRLKHLEASRKNREVPLDEAILDQLCGEHAVWDKRAFEEGADVFERLGECLKMLDDESRELVDRFYQRREKCDEIARASGLQPQTVRKRLERIRHGLRLCLESGRD